MICNSCGSADRYRNGRCRPCRLAADAKWRAANMLKMRMKSSQWKKANSEKCKASSRRRYKNIQCKLAQTLRARLGNNLKSGSAVRDLGCSIAELKTYLESKFQPDMTWENWALDGWHIDHIKPLCSFDLTIREQFLKACHYSNLRPLWAFENQSKGAKNDK